MLGVSAGTELLHFRLVEKIGEGGMGAVWKAVDTTLDREVAVKILPDAFSQNAERLGRFEREAKLLASLNHPNIAAVYGLHESSVEEGQPAVRFLVMELISGEDLSKRLASGALSVDESLRVALEVAKALEAAHENGIVHRDLKPANIQLTADGGVKVLDFGLAKAFSPDPSGGQASPTMSPTLTSAGTVAGMILGTAAYMAPEQAKGTPVDRRADIWAFGVVLYEMLTGGQLFTGDTISETLAAVLLKDSDLGALPADTPPPVRALLERCLTKNPKARLRDIGEARIALEQPGASTLSTIAIPAPAVATAPAWRRLVPWALAAAVVLLVLLAQWAPWRPAPEPPTPLRLTVELAPEAELFADYGAAAVISPDGKRLVFVSGSAAGRTLFLRSLDQLEPREISGTEEGYHPFFSPDGQWVGFVTREKLKKVSAFGGTPISVADVSLSRGASWGADGTIVYAPSPNSALLRIPDEGGTPEPLTELDEVAEEFTHRWPQHLPGSKAVLFTAHTSAGSFDDAHIEVVELDSGKRKVLHRGGSYARYVPTGYVVFVRESALYALPFDLDGLEVTGSPFPILEGVTSNPTHGSSQFDFSSTGILVYSQGTSISRMASLKAIARDGRVSTLSSEPAEFYGQRFSPDGKKIVLYIGNFDDADIWVIDLERGTRTRLTFADKSDFEPVWTPDGREVTFSSGRDGIPNIYRKPVDGSREPERITESLNVQVATSWSPDGRFLLISELTNDNGWDVVVLDTESGETRTFFESKFQDTGPAFSPDGRWVAYASNEAGRYEVYVRPFPGPGGKWQISTDGGARPRWSPDGTKIYYHAADDKVAAVSVAVDGDHFSAGNPEIVADLSSYIQDFFTSFDIDPVTGRIAVLEASGDDAEQSAPDRSKVNLVVHWFEQLERMASSGVN